MQVVRVLAASIRGYEIAEDHLEAFAASSLALLIVDTLLGYERLGNDPDNRAVLKASCWHKRHEAAGKWICAISFNDTRGSTTFHHRLLMLS